MAYYAVVDSSKHAYYVGSVDYWFGHLGFNVVVEANLPAVIGDGDLVLRVKIPARDRETLKKQTKVNVHSLNILDIIKVTDWPGWNNPAFCIEATSARSTNLQFVKCRDLETWKVLAKIPGVSLKNVRDVSREIILEVLKNAGRELAYVANPTAEMCITAVKQDGRALQYVPADMQTEELCLMAARAPRGEVLQWVTNQTEQICDLACQYDIFNIRHTKFLNATICRNAVERYGDLLKYVKEQTEELCLIAVRKDGLALQYVKEQTEAIRLVAVTQNERAIMFVSNPSREVSEIAVAKIGMLLKYVTDQTEQICLAAVANDGLAIKYVKKQTYPVCLAAVRQNGLAIAHVQKRRIDLCCVAIKKNYLAFYHIPFKNLQLLKCAINHEQLLADLKDDILSDSKLRKAVETKYGVEKLLELHRSVYEDVLDGAPSDS